MRPRRCLWIALLLAGCAAPPALPPTFTPAATLTPPRTLTPLPPSATPGSVALSTLTPLPTPTPVASAAPAAPEPPRIRLLFTGDINPGRCPARIALANGDFTLAYQAVVEELRAADITVGSLDGALSDVSPPMPCPQSMNLVGPARAVEGLQFAGFDVITVATNHAQDCGRSGFGCDGRALRDTLATLAAAGIAPAGGGATLAEARAPVIVERRGVRFAFLGVCAVCDDLGAGEARPGVARLSINDLIADIAGARASAEVVIVLPQWGMEYTETPTAEQRAWVAQMIEAGAALVVGNHPHLIQGYEIYPNALAAYALGNFVFDQGPWRTRQGVVLEAVFHGAQLETWRLLPIHIYDYHQPRWAEGDEAQAILERVAALSADLAQR